MSLALIIVLLPAGFTAANAAESVQNGDFETATLTGWTDVSEGSGAWFNYTGTSAPISSYEIPAPPEGTRAAISDQTGPTSHILYQDVVLAPGQTHDLSFFVYYDNRSSDFVTPETLSHTEQANQQYRIDVMDPTAPVSSVALSDVHATIFRTAVGDPLTLAPTLVEFDLTPWAGSTVRLRFAQVATQFHFQAGVDAVSVTSTVADSDGDGVHDDTDNCDEIANADQADTDGDGVGDACDAFPNDATESKDSDGDGVGDNSDAFPNDATESKDSDGDGVGDNSDNLSECPDGSGDLCVRESNESQEVEVSDSTVRVPACDGDVTITGDNNSILVTGDGSCTIQVVGTGNTIVNNSGAHIVIRGNGNEVVVPAGGDVIVDGDGNSVALGDDAAARVSPRASETTPSTVSVVGDGNHVDSTLQDVRIAVAGSGNTIRTAGANDEVAIISGSNNTVRTRDGDDIVVIGPVPGSVSDDFRDLIVQTAALVGESVEETANNLVATGSGTDAVYGGHGTDLIRTGAGRDVVGGRGGNDQIRGGRGADLLRGGAGRDLVRGRAGADQIRGGREADLLHGGTGDDSLFGGAGPDVINGRSGADSCKAGFGRDEIRRCEH